MKKEETSTKKPRLSKEEAKQKRLDELKHTKNKTFFYSNETCFRWCN